MSESSPAPRLWTCPSCGRRVPLRAPECHCGMTRDRALEIAAAAPAEASAPARPAGGPGPQPGPRMRGDRRGTASEAWSAMPGDVRALLVGAALALVAGLGWTAFGPARRDTTPAVLGWVEPGREPAPRPRLPAPSPAPPFAMPWWR